MPKVTKCHEANTILCPRSQNATKQTQYYAQGHKMPPSRHNIMPKVTKCHQADTILCPRSQNATKQTQYYAPAVNPPPPLHSLPNPTSSFILLYQHLKKLQTKNTQRLCRFHVATWVVWCTYHVSLWKNLMIGTRFGFTFFPQRHA